MCYIIAKRFKQPGCVAFKTEFGKALSQFSRRLQNELNNDIEIVTISSPEGYGEYAPYRYVSSYQEFYQEAIKM